MFPSVGTISSTSRTNKSVNGKALRTAANRVKLLGSGAVLALCAAAAPQLAQAANECGVGTSVTCTSTGNNYTSGIGYTSVGDQTVNLSSGVVVDAASPNTGLAVTTTGATGVITVNGPTGVSITSEGAGAPAVSLTGLGGAINANLSTVASKGTGAIGVNATTTTGDIGLTVGSTSTAGDNATGVNATSIGGDANLTLTSVTTVGNNATGVDASSGSGDVTIKATTVSTTGSGSVGIAAFGGSGALSVTSGTLTTKGDAADGVLTSNATGDTTINVGTVTTSGVGSNGVSATNLGSGALSVTAASVTTSGKNAEGIFTSNGSGTTTINAGAISTTGSGAAGISASGGSSSATVTINTTSSVTTKGDNAAGILVSTPGNVTINVGGNVSTAGALASAIDVTPSTGTVTLNANSGVITSAKSSGVDLSGKVVAVTVGSKASISGATVGLSIDSGTSASVNNAGSLSSSGGYALFAQGGPLTLTNSGTINGAVNLASDGNVINNSGIYNATSDSVFGAGGTDVFNNTGTVNVAPTATSATSVTFVNLGAFNNKGTISLVNGHAGDNLTLPGSFTGGSGSVLAVDVAGGTTGNADTLTVLGAATGSTAIQVNAIGGGLATDHIVVASGGPGSSATAFSLTPASSNVGFISYQLIYDPTAATYALVGSPGAAVAETVKVQEAISDFWKLSADSWQAHMAADRDAAWAGGGGGQGVHGWGQLYGGARNRTGFMQTTAFGVGHGYDVSYDSNTYGFQGGLDMKTGPWVAGLTAGYAGQDMRFAATNDKTQMQGYNVGAYAGISSGGAYITVLAKYNDDRIQMGSLYTAPIDFAAHTYGGEIDLGYRFGLGSTFFVEPIGSFSYSRTHFDDISGYNSSFDFTQYTGEEGKAGLRFGASMGSWMGAKVVPFGSVVAVHEFRDNGGFVFTNGGYDFDYFNHPRGSYGHASAGLSFLNDRGVNGFIQGDYDFATGTEGGGARVGIRFAF